MKNKSISFLLPIILVLGCQEIDIPITISDIPEISFKEIEFIDGATEFDQDTLRLTLLFKDGDGDLGLRPDGEDIKDPYHYMWFFTKTDGSFVTLADRSLPGYDTLPPYEFPYTCINWRQIVDEDTLYTEPNEFHYNIYVSYFVKKNGVYEEFDFFALFEPQCNLVSFDGRFPRIALPTDQANYPITISDDIFKIIQTSPYSGELEYSMRSVLFQLTFLDDSVKLKVKIYDRSLNSSNWIETPPFVF